jgi:hypothetical protein
MLSLNTSTKIICGSIEDIDEEQNTLSIITPKKKYILRCSPSSLQRHMVSKDRPVIALIEAAKPSEPYSVVIIYNCEGEFQPTDFNKLWHQIL